MNDGFKEVRIGPKKMEIPEIWDVRKLGDCADYLNGYGFKPSQWSDQGLPIIRIQNLTDSSDEINYYDGDDLEDRYIIENGDLLVSWSATLGAYIWDGPKAALNQHIFKVKTNGDINKKFFYFALDQNISLLERKVHGSTMKHITKGTFESTQLPIPPLPEQRRIAEILSTVDDTIQKTDEVIEKAERLKKGLMQDLLTKGIGHKEFKEVQIGPKTVEIPVEWEVEKLGNFSKIIVPQRDKPKRFEGNVPWIRIEDLDGKYLDDSKSGKRVSEELIDQMNLRPYPEGTVLCSCSGNMGVCAITTSVLTSNQTFAGIVPDEKINKEYLYYFLSDNAKILQTLATGTTIPYLNKGEFKKLNIPLPSQEEQYKISNMLSIIDKKIKKEERYKQKLKVLKEGLMQDLLKGKVRVNV